MQCAACQIPDEPGIDRAEGEFAPVGLFAGARNMIQQPANLASGKVRIDDKSGFVFDQFSLASFFQAFAEISRAPILPNDCVVNGRAGFAVPDNRGFSLVGDPESGHIFGGEFGFGEYIASNFQLRRPDFARVVLNPAGLGKDLLKFFLSHGMDLTALVEEDGTGTGCPLIES